MGFFTSTPSSGQSTAPKLSTDGTPIAPNRSDRSKCWEARDVYFTCLEKHEIIDAEKEEVKAKKECPAEGRAFEANCASSWVQYFKKRRVMEYKKALTFQRLAAEGAEQLPPGVVPIPTPGPK